MGVEEKSMECESCELERESEACVEDVDGKCMRERERVWEEVGGRTGKGGVVCREGGYEL